MIAPAGEALKRTALNATHRASGAKMVDYCGWDMPVEYSGITREHLAVRTAAGLFDVSHMGEIEVRGPQALALLQHVTSNDVSRLQDYQAQYSALMLPNGSAIDDCVVHRFAPDHYFLCVNAANTDKDYAWIVQCNSFGAEVRNVSAQYSQIALQGPRAVEILAKVTEADPGDLNITGSAAPVAVASKASWRARATRARTVSNSISLRPPPRICGTRYWTRAGRKD